jgi:signal transduction histidine kinase
MQRRSATSQGGEQRPEGDAHAVRGPRVAAPSRRLRALLHSVVGATHHPLAVVDGEARVIAANPAFERAFGTAAVATAGRCLYDLAGGRLDLVAVRCLVEEVLPQAAALVNREIDLDDGAGGRRTMLASGQRIAGIERARPLLLLALEDVTDSRRAVVELCSLNAELERRVSDRTAQLQAANRELEAFSYSVSHDLRSPLRAISGFSDELLRSHAAALDERGRHYLARVRSASERMAELIDDLLDLSRIGRDAMAVTTVDLSALAAAAGAELAQRHPGREVALTVEPGLVAEGDPRLLRVALENLLDNAWKFTANNTQANVHFGCEQVGARAAFFTRDDGAGFDMAHAGNLFGAFQRLHSERDFSGTGVGLATVKRVVHRHGGEVWAEGEPGVGATFYFTLPAGEVAP